MLLTVVYEVDLFLEEEGSSSISLPNAFAKKKKFSIEASVYHSWNDESQLHSSRKVFSSRIFFENFLGNFTLHEL